MKYITYKKYIDFRYKENFCGIIIYSSKDFYIDDKDDSAFAIQYVKGGKCHREGGPAAILSRNNIKKYYLFGKEVTIEQHNFYIDLLKLKGFK